MEGLVRGNAHGRSIREKGCALFSIQRLVGVATTPSEASEL